MDQDESINYEDPEQITEALTQRARQQGGYLMVHVPLPFKLPLESGLTFLWEESEPRQLELVHYPWVELANEGEPFLGNPEPRARQGDPEEVGTYTVARFGTALTLSDAASYKYLTMNPNLVRNKNAETAQDRFVNELVEQGLSVLNSIIRAYRIITWDVSVYPLSMPESIASYPTDVPSGLVCSLWNITNTRTLALGEDPTDREDIELLNTFSHVLHFGTASHKNVVDDSTRGYITSLALEILCGDANPVLVSGDLLRSAGTKGASGNYNSMVIESVTSVEILVSSLLRLQFEQEGKEQVYIDNVLFKAGLKNLLADHLAPRLGFDFDKDHPHNPVEKWYSSGYQTRNEIVHRGYFVTPEAGRRAFTESFQMADFLTELFQQQSTGLNNDL